MTKNNNSSANVLSGGAASSSPHNRHPPYTHGFVDGQVKGHVDNHGNGYVLGQSTGESKGLHTSPPPIAICGLGMRLPGGIRDAEGFWNLLRKGQDSRGRVPLDRYNTNGFNASLGSKDAIETEYGYFLDEDLTCLDTSFFTMSKDELERTDPQQRQLLEVTRECLENAAEVDWRGKLIGCYVGTFGDDWLHMSTKEPQGLRGYVVTGLCDLMIANRVSYEYDFRGPSMVIKTGCSSSLVALHEACRALQNGDCSAAIVAGTNLILGPTTTTAMTGEGVLSPVGSCKTFDATADGYARGEAVTAIYIKRLSDAIQHKNPVRAVIRNIGTNSDGRSQGLLTPSSESHEALMRKVYLDAGLDPGETAYVECHGTGTPAGDPIETVAVGNVFGEKGVLIGAVKPNVGHSEGASGLTSIIKAVLSLENVTIPPNIKYTKPNPKIPFEEKHLKVPVKATLWPEDRAKRISVNSFGIGGTNAHVIIDSADAFQSQTSNHIAERVKDSPQLLVLSANTQDSLRRQVCNYQEYIKLHPERLSDVIYTSALYREHLPHRAFSIIREGSVDNLSSFSKATNNVPEIVMVFSGQGAQWPEMGRGLIRTNQGFQDDIAAMDCILQSLKHPPNWKIENELQKCLKTSRINQAEFAQPLCTAIQIAVVNVLDRWSIRPTAVIGHSSGEIAAAYTSGALSFREAMIIAYYRGYVTRKQTLAGGMAAVGLDASSASAFFKGGLVIACENSPNSTTISGDLDQLDKVLTTIEEERPDVPLRRLRVDMAYHSHHMKHLSGEYRALIDDETLGQKPGQNHLRIPFFSTVTEEIVETSGFFGSEYWASNLTSPVRFNSTVNSLLLHHSNSVFLEIGPHSTLAGPLRQICSKAGTTCLYIPTMLRNKECKETLLSALGQLYQQGISMDFGKLISGGNVLTDLPAYPWSHSASYWYESRLSKNWRFREFSHHCLLGLRVPECTSIEPCWRNVLRVEDESWLYDHKVQGDVVFPFTGYAAMAGEAVRQITGINSGYSLRHVIAYRALVLSDSKPVEMVTTLRPHRLTDSADSDWYDFIISSYSGSVWLKNCEGQVKSYEETALSSLEINALPRTVVPPRLYEALADIGLVYGPEFQGLTAITSSTTESLSTGEITNSRSRQEAPFVFHPASMDACLQLLLVAMAKGLNRNIAQLSVPTMIEELDISRSALKMYASAWDLDSQGDAQIECVADGKIVLRLRGCRLAPLDDERTIALSDRHAAARLKWHPDFDFVDVSTLFKAPVSEREELRLQEEMTLLCMLDSAERLQNIIPEQPHFTKYRDWIWQEICRAESDEYPLIERTSSLVKLSRPDRLTILKDRFSRLLRTPKGPVATGVMRVCDNVEAIFTGKTDTLDVLMRDNVLTEIYNATSFGQGDFVRMLSNTKPNLRILEVGAGTGGTTELILRDLADSHGTPAYSIYTFTDISAGFFPQAKERFSYASNMEYRVFDISQDAFKQGFEAASYDLILAANVIHATVCLQETLQNLKPLLKPRGHLVLTELCTVSRTSNYVFGNFSGWWLGEADDRKDEPYVSVDRWDRELKAAGFTGVDTAIYDADEPHHQSAVIVTQPRPVAKMSPPRSITILCDRPDEGISRNLIEDLKEGGFTLSVCRLEEFSQQEHDIISTLDLEVPFFEKVTEKRFSAFQQFLRKCKAQKILWLTAPTQILCKNPRSAQSIGMARTIRPELAIPFFTLEIDWTEPEFSRLIMQVFEKIRNCEDTETLAPDREFAVDKGIIKFGRYHPITLKEELAGESVASSSPLKTLEIAKAGQLNTFQWIEERLPGDLQNDAVEIEAHAVGLNYHDLIVAMGIIPSGLGDVHLGQETAGVIRRVGSAVLDLAVGDRIFALADGCLRTRMTLPASLCVRIPHSLSFEEAATMPACFATVLHSLVNLGQLAKDQTVLIHSACGGVGHAAIQICKVVGAQVFATVSNDEKVQHLRRKFDIPRQHIFNSRDGSFASDLMRETRGRGVDIVLNSLSGELLHASWKCVAPFGKLIELGKRDLLGFGKLGMESLLENRSYCAVDIAHLRQHRQGEIRRLLERCLEMYCQGDIHPISPTSLFEASDIEQAFRFLQKGNHIGKVVVRISEDSSEIAAVARVPILALDSEAAYLLAGGLGGLGRSVATRLVERGARCLIFLSRRAGTGFEHDTFFKELKSLGCSAYAVAGEVQNIEDVNRAISKTTRKIKGVIQFAMVLRDAPIVDMTYEDWVATTAPKVDGTWNLHNGCLKHPLEFFFLASSLVTLADQPGQSNYNAANTFLEAFCQYRHSLGLPASVLNICPVKGVGFVAENPLARKKIKAQGLYSLGEREFLDFVELSLVRSDPPTATALPNDLTASWENANQVVMGLRSNLHLDDPNNRTNWRRDRRMGMYHNIRNIDTDGASSANSNKIQNFLSSAVDDPDILSQTSSADYLAQEIGQKVFSLMLKPEEDIDISMSLTQIGLDSLMAIELRRWWKQVFGLDISVLELMASGTLARLGKIAAEATRSKYQNSEG